MLNFCNVNACHSSIQLEKMKMARLRMHFCSSSFKKIFFLRIVQNFTSATSYLHSCYSQYIGCLLTRILFTCSIIYCIFFNCTILYKLYSSVLKNIVRINDYLGGMESIIYYYNIIVCLIILYLYYIHNGY